MNLIVSWLLAAGSFVYAPVPSTQICYLTWDLSPLATTPTPAGYRVHLGVESTKYLIVNDVGYRPASQLQLIAGIRYYAVVAGYNADGVEGPLSKEISFTVTETAASPIPAPAGSPKPTPAAPTGFVKK